MSDRLNKLLNMLASPHDGEVANAGRMIAAVAKTAGKTVSELVRSGGEQIVYRDRIVEKVIYKDRIVYRDRPAAVTQSFKKTFETTEDAMKRFNTASEEFTKTKSRVQQEDEDDAKLREALTEALVLNKQLDFLSDWEIDFIMEQTCLFPRVMSSLSKNIAKQILRKARRAQSEPLI